MNLRNPQQNAQYSKMNHNYPLIPTFQDSKIIDLVCWRSTCDLLDSTMCTVQPWLPPATQREPMDVHMLSSSPAVNRVSRRAFTSCSGPSECGEWPRPRSTPPQVCGDHRTSIPSFPTQPSDSAWLLLNNFMTNLDIWSFPTWLVINSWSLFNIFVANFDPVISISTLRQSLTADEESCNYSWSCPLQGQECDVLNSENISNSYTTCWQYTTISLQYSTSKYSTVLWSWLLPVFCSHIQFVMLYIGQ